MAKREVPITYRKSFMAKYILSDDRVKHVYGVIKNKLMSIKGMKSRISWFYDAFNVGRINFAKLSVRGKYLALYLNLNIDDYPSNIYHQENVMDRRRYKDTCFKIHVKSDRTIKYAFRLIEDEIKKFNLKKGPIPKENYYLNYEPEEPLIERGLIKLEESKNEINKYSFDFKDSDKLVIEDDNLFTQDLIDNDNQNVSFTYVDGSKVFIKERKSFEAKLYQSNEQAKRFYSIIKNRLLSFTKVKSRMSWKYESFNLGRTKLAKIQVRGRYLVLYLALDTNKYELSKERFENAIKYELFKDTPLMVRIKNDELLNRCLELILDLKKRFLLDEGFIKQNNDYTEMNLSSEELIKSKKIRLYKKYGDYSSPQEEKLVTESISIKKNNFPVYKKEKKLVLTIDKNNNFVEDFIVVNTPVEGVRTVVYLDIINKIYNDGDTVDLDSLKYNGIINEDTKFIKIIYRGGEFNKKLTIKAHVFSPIALKIIEDSNSNAEVIEV